MTIPVRSEVAEKLDSSSGCCDTEQTPRVEPDAAISVADQQCTAKIDKRLPSGLMDSVKSPGRETPSVGDASPSPRVHPRIPRWVSGIFDLIQDGTYLDT